MPTAAAAAFLKKKGMTAAEWKAKTGATWAKNHPAPLFPSTNITPAERTRLMGDARSSVTKSYAAAPMPAQASYLQPFADAHARTVDAGANYVNYLDSSARNAQNLSGAFDASLTNGIQRGQADVAAQGGSGTPGAIPSAAASLIPAASVGSSFANYLNAERPYVGAAVNETTRQLNQQQAAAAGDYQTAAASRRAEVQDAISKLFTSSLDSLQGSKIDANKAAVTEYLAMGKTAYQKAQLAQRTKHDTTTEGIAQQNATTAAARVANTKAYQQASLDAKRKSAKTAGIDLGPAYSTLLVSTPGKATGPGAKTGPSGQSGRSYTVTPITYLASGTAIEGKPVKRTVYYGEQVPIATKDKEGRVTQRVAAGAYTYPNSQGSAAATRKATPASWDRAVKQLRAKYPGRITATWLAQNFPPRPSGS
jgi:hypothetical protein